MATQRAGRSLSVCVVRRHSLFPAVSCPLIRGVVSTLSDVSLDEILVGGRMCRNTWALAQVEVAESVVLLR